MNPKVEQFTKHNKRGQSVLAIDSLQWRDPVTNSEIFGPLDRWTWIVDGLTYEKKDFDNILLKIFPDASGFICVELDGVVDNCLLLDCYGNKRMRLTVPWHLSKFPPQTEEEEADCRFRFATTEPYTNPTTGEKGQFGVAAYVAKRHLYYFELDWHTGEFLWGREIRD